MYGTAYPPYERTREEERTVTADWMKRWGLHEQAGNHPYAGRTPTTLAYLHRYDIGSGVSRPKKKKRDHTGIQKKPIHDDTFYHESNSWRS